MAIVMGEICDRYMAERAEPMHADSGLKPVAEFG
jgi:hypothetical protein